MANQQKNKKSTATALAPSNIAIVKYWGKKGVQEPVNPSISFTLSEAQTKTTVQHISTKENLKLEFYFQGDKKPAFIPKLETLTNRLKAYLPFLNKGLLTIESSNTFPHSSGIASSASSMASMAHAFLEIQKNIDPDCLDTDQNKLLSEMARLGSGSSCRSTMKGWVLWGKTALIEQSSNRYGLSINDHVHPIFNELEDSILVIRKGVKAVSSTVGHQLMDQHPYAAGRIEQANSNINKLLKALQTGDFNAFSQVCEEEAMSLHGLMMSSSPSYTLLAPESIRAIEQIKKFKEQNQVQLTFTLDAGPNLHLIYPKSQSKIVVPFIETHLKPLCENQEVIYDRIAVK